MRKNGWLTTYIIFSMIMFFIGFTAGCSRLYFKREHFPGPVISIKDVSGLAFQETWHEIVFNGRKIGFSHIKIDRGEEDSEFFRVTSDVFFCLMFMGIKKEVNIKATDYIRPDLTLVEFESELLIDKKRILIRGIIENGHLFTEIDTGVTADRQSFMLNETIYPASVINIYPLLKGMEIGKKYRYLIYDPQSQSLRQVKQKVLSYEKSDFFEGAAFRIKTRLASLSTTSWINDQGETIFEMALGGALIIAREEAAAARRFIGQKSFGKTDDFADFCLIKTSSIIPRPREIKTLHVELEGLHDKRLIIHDQRQKVTTRSEGGSRIVLFQIETSPRDQEKVLNLPILDNKFQHYLAPSRFIQSQHPEITAKTELILGDESEGLSSVRKLAHWVCQTVTDRPTDSFSALEVLRVGEGECQAHAYLYTALARAGGIPSRVVSGLVYLEESGGFLYHSWAESYIGYWIAVDPTFGQVPADASHIKLIEGESLEDLEPLINIVGRLKASVIDYQ